VLPDYNSPKLLCINSLIVILIVSSLTPICLGQADSKQQAMIQKAQWTLRIAEEQFQRGLYSEAEHSLAKIQREYAGVMSEEDLQTASDLRLRVQTALSERARVATLLSQSDEYAANQQYDLARSRLQEALNSNYLTKAEREQINLIVNDIDQQVATQQVTSQPEVTYDSSSVTYETSSVSSDSVTSVTDEISPVSTTGESSYEASSGSVGTTVVSDHGTAPALKSVDEGRRIANLFNASVDLFEAGQYAQSRPGFVEVANSGFNYTADGLKSTDYINMVDLALGKNTPSQLEQPQQQGDSFGDRTGDSTGPAEISYQARPMELEPIGKDVSGTLPVAQQEQGYIRQIEQKRNRQINYTRAIVNDSVVKAEKFTADKKFDKADQAIARAFTTINKNKMLLGDELFTKFNGQLDAISKSISRSRAQHTTAVEEQTRIETEKLRSDIRKTAEERRIKAVQDYMARASAFQEQQRYEEALGQLEQVLAIDPTNQRALILSQTLEDTVRWREQLKIQKEIDTEELSLLLETQKKNMPYFNEVNYYGADRIPQPKNWKELTAGRGDEAMVGQSRADALVYKQLEQIVDLTDLTEDTSLVDALEIVSNASTPPLTIVVLWGDLSENAFLEQEEPIKMSGRGLSAIKLRTGLDRLLQAVGGGLAELGFVVEDGIVTIATTESLPSNYVNNIYDVSELLGAPADFAYDLESLDSGGGSGGRGGGGSSSSRGGGGGSSRGGGGSSRGGSSGGSGSSGDLTGTFETEYRASEIIWIIQQTIEPDTWYDVGGEGQIYTFGGTKLIVWQTPEIHEKIRNFLDSMRDLLGQQVAIESRFLLVDENFLEDIGFDVDFQRFQLGGNISSGGSASFLQNSFNIAAPSATSITSSLGAQGAYNSGAAVGSSVGAAIQTSFGYGGITDDLQVNFIIRATQAHANSKSLTAPKIMVLSGESAVIRIQKERTYVSNISLTSDTQAATTQADTTPFAITNFDQEISILPTGIVMNVTPIVTTDQKYVILRISTSLMDELESQSATNTFTGVIGTGAAETVGWEEPVVEYTDIMTRVVVPDRGTVLLGGLTLTAEREVDAGVPVLSKVPLIGRLFSNRSEVKDKQILLVLVKPTIILKDEVEAAAIAAMQ